MAAPTSPPPFAFVEEDEFRDDKEALFAEGVTPQEFDSHLFAIQDSVVNDPFAEPWSRPVPDEPGFRSAVSSATPAEPNALVVVFRVDGDLIRLCHVRLR